jgi:hypothetical protein
VLLTYSVAARYILEVYLKAHKLKADKQVAGGVIRLLLIYHENLEDAISDYTATNLD